MTKIYQKQVCNIPETYVNSSFIVQIHSVNFDFNLHSPLLFVVFTTKEVYSSNVTLNIPYYIFPDYAYTCVI